MRKPQPSQPKHLQTKSLHYGIVKNVPRVLLLHLKVEKTKLENFDVVILSSSFFIFLLLNTWLKNHRAHMNILHVKWILYYRKSAFSGSELHASHDWCVIILNMHHGRLPRGHFMRTFGHNLQTIGHIVVFYIPNDLDTIGGIASWL